MKKIITMLFILAVICFCFTNIYATDFNNSTEIINIYNEYNATKITDNVFDTLSIGIIVASVVIIAGVVFFYLIPKE